MGVDLGAWGILYIWRWLGSSTGAVQVILYPTTSWPAWNSGWDVGNTQSILLSILHVYCSGVWVDDTDTIHLTHLRVHQNLIAGILLISIQHTLLCTYFPSASSANAALLRLKSQTQVTRDVHNKLRYTHLIILWDLPFYSFSWWWEFCFPSHNIWKSRLIYY